MQRVPEGITDNACHTTDLDRGVSWPYKDNHNLKHNRKYSYKLQATTTEHVMMIIVANLPSPTFVDVGAPWSFDTTFAIA